jgi:2-polyprenyl-6-methoxyphenol hydroxylase-like FAD-dependent oxidoreductase
MDRSQDASPPSRELTCRCCVVGGGPAGMMLGLLLARAGIDVIVIEKHADFLRDFRGDTIHPSTMEALNDLGLLDEFLELPHQEARQLATRIGACTIPLADFSHLPTRAKFIAFMPQWDFLNFLARKAAQYPHFRLLMSTEAVSLLKEGARIAGVSAKTAEGALTIRADLTVGADGRHSRVREDAGFRPLNIGAPMDVLWFRLSRRAEDASETFGRIDAGQFLIFINRGDHWQCGYVIAKGSAEALKGAGIAALRAKIAALAPVPPDRLQELASVDDLKLLSVAVDRLPLWHRPGLLCIGDAAHAMSPVGGVGINLAIQDAIATANLLSTPLLDQPRPPDECLARVQARREFPAKATQAMQVFIQKKLISRIFEGGGATQPPALLRLFVLFPVLRRLPARLIGIGIRPERIRSPLLPPERPGPR